MKNISLCLLVLTTIFVTGCPKYRPPVDFNNPNGLVNKLDLNQRLKIMQDRYWCYRFNFDYDGSKTNPCTGTVTDGPAKAKALRNEFLETAIPFIDDSYVGYITDLQRGRDRANFVADVVELGTSAAVGITNGERAIQIMGVALTAFRGGRRSADLNFYKEQTTPILITKMDGNRAKVRQTILNREKSDVDTYPIGAAISDIVDYYNAGTLVRAFTELSKDTAAQAKESEDRVLELKGVPLSPVATPEEVQITSDAQVTLGKLQAALNDAAQKPAATAKLQAIIAELAKDKDANIVLIGAGLTPQSDGDSILNGLVRIRRDLRLANPPNIALLNKINATISKFGN